MREQLEILRSTMREKESELWRIEHGDLDELDPRGRVGIKIFFYLVIKHARISPFYIVYICLYIDDS